MSKKQQPIVSTQKTEVDPAARAMQAYTFKHGQAILDPYINARGPEGYGVADFNTDQTNAFQGIRSLASANGGGLDPNAYKTWMNPYQEAVVDTTTGRIQRQGNEALNAVRGRTAAGSAFGGVGARGALQAAKTQEGTQRQIAETTAQLMSQGYTQAQAMAMANRELQSSSLQSLLGIGNQQQQLAQQKWDTPLRALQIAQGITPQQYGSTMTTTQPAPQGPSTLQTVLGLAGTLGGAFLGGPMGASLGGSLGSGLGGLRFG